MIVNKHSSFYMRSGWGTKIIQAVDENDMIFSPSNEQIAIDNIGLGRIMIKALRYWSNVMGLTEETKVQSGVKLVPTDIFYYIRDNDLYFQRRGSLLLMHRNLSLNKENATAWYWLFNEMNSMSFTKESFVEGFQAYLAVNAMKIKKDAIDKEFLCVKNTYIGEEKFDRNRMVDEDTYPFLAPLQLITSIERNSFEKRLFTDKEVPVEILIYAIPHDNIIESTNCEQINIDKIIEEKCQIGKYFPMKYSTLLELLMEAENKKYINLNNNFGNRFIEFTSFDYSSLLNKYYKDWDEEK